MNILVSVPFCEVNRNKIMECAQRSAANIGMTVSFTFADPLQEKETYEKALRTSHIIIGNPSIEDAQSAKKLRYVQATNAGTERFTGRPGFPEHVILCNMTGAFGPIISEYVLAGILTMYRRFPEYIRRQESGSWMDVGSELALTGKTALILGAGDIGTNVAKRLRAFDVTTIGIRRVVREKPDCYDEMRTLDALDELLPRADIVVGCMPKTKLTCGLLNEARLRMLPENGLIVNVGRGSLIVTEDLVRVLESGHLLGAVLDVTDPEPLPCDHPLWKMKNTLITPHISGISFGHTPHVETLVTDICCENLSAYLEGRPMRNLVDRKTGYRSL